MPTFGDATRRMTYGMDLSRLEGGRTQGRAAPRATRMILAAMGCLAAAGVVLGAVAMVEQGLSTSWNLAGTAGIVVLTVPVACAVGVWTALVVWLRSGRASIAVTVVASVLLLVALVTYSVGSTWAGAWGWGTALATLLLEALTFGVAGCGLAALFGVLTRPALLAAALLAAALLITAGLLPWASFFWAVSPLVLPLQLIGPFMVGGPYSQGTRRLWALIWALAGLLTIFVGFGFGYGLVGHLSSPF